MTEQEARLRFPRASESFIKANVSGDEQPKIVQPKLRGTRIPNQTEREYALILEAQKRDGKILRFEFEGIRLKWGVDPETGAAMWYKPDFFVTVWRSGSEIPPHCQARCIEVKGPWINPRDLVRFKGCRAEWPEFQFEMWQRINGRWTQIQ